MNERGMNLESVMPRKEHQHLECNFNDVDLGDFTLHHQTELEADRFEPTYTVHVHADAVEPNDSGLIDFLSKKIRDTRKEREKFSKPREQYRFVDQESGQELCVSNYTDDPINKDKIDEISNWFSLMVAISKDGFSHVKNIFIMPESRERTHLGQPVKGESKRDLGGFCLYPGAFQQEQHRVGNVSMLSGTMTHEFFHQYIATAGTTKVSKEWMDVSGRSLHFMYPEPIAGRDEISDLAKKAESEYGEAYSAEEFCESAAKAVYNGNNFNNNEKRKFIDDNFIDLSKAPSARRPQIIKVDEPQQPSFPDIATFATIKIGEK